MKVRNERGVVCWLVCKEVSDVALCELRLQRKVLWEIRLSLIRVRSPPHSVFCWLAPCMWLRSRLLQYAVSVSPFHLTILARWWNTSAKPWGCLPPISTFTSHLHPSPLFFYPANGNALFKGRLSPMLDLNFYRSSGMAGPWVSINYWYSYVFVPIYQLQSCLIFWAQT